MLCMRIRTQLRIKRKVIRYSTIEKPYIIRSSINMLILLLMVYKVHTHIYIEVCNDTFQVRLG
jgi:hypothetical protein